MHLLLAEDDKISRELLRRIIESEAHSVTLAENGAEAWRQLSENPGKYDAVVCDICMPTLGGIELIEKLRADDDLKKTPVILCSAVSDRLTVQKAVALGVTHYVVKPYSRALMSEKLKQIKAALPVKSAQTEAGIIEAKELVCQRLGIDSDTYREMVGSIIEETTDWGWDLRASTGREAVENAFIRGRGLRGSCLSSGLKRAAKLMDVMEKILESYLTATDPAKATLPQGTIDSFLTELDNECAAIRSKLRLPKSPPKRANRGADIESPPPETQAAEEATV
ncbi:MAG TPA: response regulator [Opitutaceae bacterium]|jgi:two-component system chemotaxis response regulator CheY